MPHFGFEAYGKGFFGKLLHGRGILPRKALDDDRRADPDGLGTALCVAGRHPAGRGQPQVTLTSDGGAYRTPRATESLENAKFYHGVALPRQSLASCCGIPVFFCTPPTPVL
jgi:hypothetical protein